ncbi:MAG: M1 family metallopeptidase [candidate division Zixibacteria bacterium]|nr:M1 family metallopeptidase [candidate division Zixibacteria bacterium]
MMIIFILVTLLLFSIPIFSNDMPDPSYFIGIDPDTMTASQNHSILAMGKANQLDSSRKKSAISRSSFYDQTEYDVEYYSIEIAIDIEREYVDSATVKISAKSMIDGLSFIELDFLDSLVFTNEIYMDTIWDTNLVVDSIYIETDPLNYEHVSNKLLVELDRPYNTGENFSFLVRYHGELFENYRYDYDGDYRMNGVGLAFGIQQSWVNGMEGTKVAYTNSEPYESRNWWPCKDRPDDKADSVDISVIVPELY